jgi:hypothetical protein
MSGAMEREISGVPLENARFDTKMVYEYSTKLRSIMELQVQLLICRNGGRKCKWG